MTTPARQCKRYVINMDTQSHRRPSRKLIPTPLEYFPASQAVQNTILHAPVKAKKIHQMIKLQVLEYCPHLMNLSMLQPNTDYTQTNFQLLNTRVVTRSFIIEPFTTNSTKKFMLVQFPVRSEEIEFKCVN